MIIRTYEPSDCESLAELFYDTVHTVNAKDYTEEQLNVWATGKVDLEAWNKSFLDHYTVVVIEDDIIVGFGDMDDTGYLDRLYVHKDYQNRGVATMICNELENTSEADKFSTHASITARPFFEKRGYKVVKEQQVERGGILLTNYVMEKLGLKILTLNFKAYKKLMEETVYNRRVSEFLKKWRKENRVIIAGQELPKNLEQLIKNDGDDTIVCEGEISGRSNFFTGFCMINQPYELIDDKKISDIWNELFAYSPAQAFRNAYWKEIRFKYEKESDVEIRMINIHISPTYDIRLRYSLLQYIETIKDDYIIILGDFNAAEYQDTDEKIPENDRFLKEIKRNGFEELRSKNEEKGHYTHYGKNKKGRKIDHIFVSNKLYHSFRYNIEYIDEVNYTHPNYDKEKFSQITQEFY